MCVYTERKKERKKDFMHMEAKSFCTCLMTLYLTMLSHVFPPLISELNNKFIFNRIRITNQNPKGQNTKKGNYYNYSLLWSNLEKNKYSVELSTLKYYRIVYFSYLCAFYSNYKK
jgi:hypothetical protein